MTVKKAIIADDHPLFRSALGKCLEQNFRDIEILHCHDFDSLQEITRQHRDADLLLLDLMMPGCRGFSGLLFITDQREEIPVIVISAHEEPHIIRQSIDYGAAGFLSKSASAETIIEAITRVLAGGIWVPEGVNHLSMPVVEEEEEKVRQAIKKFTPQQFRVAMLLASGLSNKEIAFEMDVTQATVKAHLTSIFRKLEVSSRTRAVLALRYLNIDPDPPFMGKMAVKQ